MKKIYSLRALIRAIWLCSKLRTEQKLLLIFLVIFCDGSQNISVTVDALQKATDLSYPTIGVSLQQLKELGFLSRSDTKFTDINLDTLADFVGVVAPKSKESAFNNRILAALQVFADVLPGQFKKSSRDYAIMRGILIRFSLSLKDFNALILQFKAAFSNAGTITIVDFKNWLSSVRRKIPLEPPSTYRY